MFYAIFGLRKKTYSHKTLKIAFSTQILLTDSSQFLRANLFSKLQPNATNFTFYKQVFLDDRARSSKHKANYHSRNKSLRRLFTLGVWRRGWASPSPKKNKTALYNLDCHLYSLDVFRKPLTSCLYFLLRCP